MNIEYDIAIRTVGRGGEKYEKLLDSILKLNPQPQNVFVVLPKGVQPPKEQKGFETFVYVEKGMMSQRALAVEYIESPFALFCDDDLSFESDFIAKLYKAISNQGYDIVTGELLELLPPKNCLKQLYGMILASAYPAIFNKKRFVKILRSSGWTYNRYVPKEGVVLPTQSAAGALFFTKKECLEKLNLLEEIKWAQHGTLAPAEDQITYYKAHKLGFKVGVVTDAHFNHLDAKSSTASHDAIKNKQYWSGFNRGVFWHRFIYSTEKNTFGKTLAVIAFTYYKIAHYIDSIVWKLLSPKKNQFSSYYLKGLKDAKRYTKSNEYKSLEKIQ